MNDGMTSATTTSAGMPPLGTSHEALDQGTNKTAEGMSGALGSAQKLRASATDRIRGIADEGKAQVTSTLSGLVTAANEIADRLQNSGGAPVADYVRKVAIMFEGWSHSVENKSIEDLADDAKTMVRKSPALAIGIALASGFALSRFLKATSGGAYTQTR